MLRAVALAVLLVANACASRAAAPLVERTGATPAPSWVRDGLRDIGSQGALASVRRAVAASATVADLIFGDGFEQLCGNGVVDPFEQCDGGDLNGQSCATLGFS